MLKLVKKLILTSSICAMAISASAVGAGSEIEKIFYETAAKQNVVGGILTPCEGRPLAWGKRTAFYTVDVSPCHSNF
ncbi:DUF6289 family protein [Thalassotalea marina]|uniref:Uncharacterized protein n=1 Tax=Thalassotalea marina TaxID=1673741 RepID=A0A919EKF1_9GAMM|nr:DUF6289 family protein [Thalassotalea marina]GHF90097.1 hypothetical protein GCM10017161_17620 [Thalassotalea marina]